VSELSFRVADESDIDQLLVLVGTAYRGEESRAGWTTEADLIEGQRIDETLLRADIDAADSLVIVAEENDVLVACAHLEKSGEDAAYFGMFAVRPGLQGAGIGKQVLAHAEELVASRWGSLRIEMFVLELRLELVAFYERRGYARTGRFQPFPYEETRYGLPRREDLRMELLVKTLRAVVAPPVQPAIVEA
jgi:GNAT superfamily N-acetyltransferase